MEDLYEVKFFKEDEIHIYSFATEEEAARFRFMIANEGYEVSVTKREILLG